MYSMLFTTTMHPEYLYTINKNVTDREEKIDKLVENKLNEQEENQEKGEELTPDKDQFDGDNSTTWFEGF